jgi:hypothetical protein
MAHAVAAAATDSPRPATVSRRTDALVASVAQHHKAISAHQRRLLAAAATAARACLEILPKNLRHPAQGKLSFGQIKPLAEVAKPETDAAWPSSHHSGSPGRCANWRTPTRTRQMNKPRVAAQYVYLYLFLLDRRCSLLGKGIAFG